MKIPWTLTAGRPFGIPVYVHASLLAMIGLMATIDAITGDFHFSHLALFVVAFACVVLHEIGHAIAARRFGQETRSILLLPIGGFADIDVPEVPRQELVVAVAGPAINFAIASLLLVVLIVTRMPYETSREIDEISAAAFISWILKINVVLALFNLLPVYPMDGGRILRALIATRTSRDRATVVAATIGRWGGVLMAGVGVAMFNPIIFLLGLLMALVASNERTAARRRLASTESSQ